MKRRYRKVLRQLDESLLEPLHATRGWLGDCKRAGQLYDNLWGQFGLTKEVRAKKIETAQNKHPKLNLRELEKHLPSVMDYAWTAEVKAAFYEHPYHKAFIKRVKKIGGTALKMWRLNSEPDTFEEAPCQ